MLKMVKGAFKNKPLVLSLIFILFLVGCQKQEKKIPLPIRDKKTDEEIFDINKKLSEDSRNKERFTALINRLDRRDPFSKDHTGIYKLKVSSGSLNLGGIIYDEKKPLAIINDKIVGKGDMVEDKEIIRITPEEVILKDREKEYILKLEVNK